MPISGIGGVAGWPEVLLSAKGDLLQKSPDFLDSVCFITLLTIRRRRCVKYIFLSIAKLSRDSGWVVRIAT